ncbi:MAG: hypothetical protein JXR96_16455 [Deltaproteobacteria bacterium]|nr:hypothetical protein [Deltaproteobacteria bacterium]
MRTGFSLLGLLALACQQAPDLTPRIDAVSPEEMPLGQERYAVVHGRFSPLLHWGESLQASTRFAVRFGDQDSDHVVLASEHKLVARVPAGLGPGCHQVEVSAPDGSAASLGEALCIREDYHLQIFAECRPAGQPGWDLCALRQVGAAFELQVIASDLVPSRATPDVGQVGDIVPQFAISPNGHLLAYLRRQADRCQLSLLRLGSPEAPQVLEEAPRDDGLCRLSAPRFSPDSRWLVHLDGDQRIWARDLDADESQAAMLLVDESHSADPLWLLFPDVDIAGERLLFTRMVEPLHRPGEIELGLHIVPMTGGPARQLTPGGEQVHDGPGLFHPAGDRVLFLSDRSSMVIPSPFGGLGQSNDLYSAHLDGSQPECLSCLFPTCMGGRASILPGGRLLAMTGYRSDWTGSGWDVLLVEPESGAVDRTVQDPYRFCVPWTGCSEANLGAIFADCCGAQGCCGVDEGGWGMCPTRDYTPQLAPVGLAFLHTALPFYWQCLQIEDLIAWIGLGKSDRVQSRLSWYQDGWSSADLIDHIPQGHELGMTAFRLYFD